ncbi:MAG: GNAT family N-acetyltransferase [Defluviitaleaceae bacterium]|nr:GNAT family N-acetyltransferase [Defluviitaleaceae bacterium]
MIALQPVTWHNIGDVIDLKIHESQEGFLAPNVYGIAQAYVAWAANGHQPITLAIFKNDDAIGFAMLEYKTAEENEYKNNSHPYYYLSNFMIDKNHQGKGYGKAALKEVIKYLHTAKPQLAAASIYLSYKPNNAIARRLFASVGFVETGETEDGDDIVACLVLK